jgi:hypothetical protein
MTKFIVMMVAAVLLMTASASQAAILLQDNFDTYGSQAAFETAGTGWTPSGSTAAPNNTGLLSTAQSFSPSQSVNFPTTDARRNSKTITDTTPTAALDVEYSFRFYDTVGTSNSPRQWGALVDGAGTNSGQLLALGVTNTLTTSEYYGRVVGLDPDGTGPLASGAFFAMDATAPNRSVGWHEFRIVAKRDPSGTTGTAEFWVDGVLGKTISGYTLRGYETVQIGSSNTSAGGAAFFDDVLVQTTPTPEPASLGMMVMAAGLFLRRRRRA